MSQPATGRRRKKPVFRDGRVHVMSRLCDTCIFRPGNLMHLPEGLRDHLVAGSVEVEGCIPCHETTHGQHPAGEAVCRGFFEKHATGPLQLADRLGFIEYQKPK